MYSLRNFSYQLSASCSRILNRLSRGPPVDELTLTSFLVSLLFLLISIEELEEEDGIASQLFEREDDDDDDASLPVSETTVGELVIAGEVIAGAGEIEGEEEGAGRFLRLTLDTSVGALPELAAALAAKIS